ncbi:hypothetical protein MM1218R_01539 [Mycobacterium marinum]|uniref:hypothetical protein n=1 Tax=Mycobacterium marinum TaxID=1781 RepID=UPI000E292FE3|nr:hypothetical protein [Mycobacterium marinum]AXN43487.1 hypothetical protein MM1218R_01539 [Mycobacterium marinum]RFZ11461.1 hypothetical protein DE4381_01049 [Mycobacterium marinum]
MKQLLVAAVFAAGAAIASPPVAAADTPPPGCLYQSPNWYDPCSGVPPWVQQNGTNWSPVDGRPGMWGPHGYTPVTQQPTPGQCTDYRAACPSS